MSEDERPVVKGNMIRLVRLDEHGLPMPDAEPITFYGAVTGRFSFPETDDTVDETLPFPVLERFSVEMDLIDVDPELIYLLYGQRPPKHPRLAFALYCLRRWTVDLVADAYRWLRGMRMDEAEREEFHRGGGL